MFPTKWHTREKRQQRRGDRKQRSLTDEQINQLVQLVECDPEISLLKIKDHVNTPFSKNLALSTIGTYIQKASRLASSNKL